MSLLGWIYDRYAEFINAQAQRLMQAEMVATAVKAWDEDPIAEEELPPSCRPTCADDCGSPAPPAERGCDDCDMKEEKRVGMAACRLEERDEAPSRTQLPTQLIAEQDEDDLRSRWWLVRGGGIVVDVITQKQARDLEEHSRALHAEICQLAGERDRLEEERDKANSEALHWSEKVATLEREVGVQKTAAATWSQRAALAEQELRQHQTKLSTARAELAKLKSKFAWVAEPAHIPTQLKAEPDEDRSRWSRWWVVRQGENVVADAITQKQARDLEEHSRALHAEIRRLRRPPEELEEEIERRKQAEKRRDELADTLTSVVRGEAECLQRELEELKALATAEINASCHGDSKASYAAGAALAAKLGVEYP